MLNGQRQRLDIPSLARLDLSLTDRRAWPVGNHVQTRLLRQVGGVSESHRNFNKARGSVVFESTVKHFQAVQMELRVRTHMVLFASLVSVGGCICPLTIGRLLTVAFRRKKWRKKKIPAESSLMPPPPPHSPDQIDEKTELNLSGTN